MLGKLISGEPIALKVVNKINGKLKFLYRKKRYLTKELYRMLCSALIQSHFDYACPAWNPNLNEKTKMERQIMHNKCIRFCLNLNKMHHISEKKFRLTNWLSDSKSSDQGINIETYNSLNNTFPYYLNEIFGFASHFRIGLRNNFSILKNPCCKTNMGQKRISYIGHSIWNNFLDSI